MRDLKRLKGYTIIHTGTVTGHISEDGEKKDSFEGCQFGRKLIVDYSFQVTCAGYSYSYAFNPDIVILTKGSSAKAIIDNEMYDITL